MLFGGGEAFKSYINEEINSIDSSLSYEIKNYLTDLLYFYLFSERLFEHKSENGRSYEKTLVDLYIRTSEADLQERIYLFKKMGDLSLYISGFFRVAVEKRITDLSYYEDVGQSAYHYLADHYKDRDIIFNSLSEKFKVLSEILFFIQQKSEAKNEEKYLKITK
ncbi:MAG: hypothetical protein ACR2M7_00135 [Bdellovibrionales bacterium]